MKALITATETFGAKKNINHKAFKNTAAFVVITNSAENFQVDPGTRRYVFIDTYNLFTRGYFNDFKLEGRESECPRDLRPLLDMTKDEYYSVFFEEIDWRDIVSYFLFEHEITPGFSTNTIVNTAKLLDLKIKSETRLTKFLVEAIHNPSVYDEMEKLDKPHIDGHVEYTHHILATEFNALINMFIPTGYVSSNSSNIGKYRNEISRRLIKCIAIITTTTDNVVIPGGLEKVTYFYLSSPDEVAKDVARIIGTPVEDIKSMGKSRAPTNFESEVL